MINVELKIALLTVTYVRERVRRYIAWYNVQFTVYLLQCVGEFVLRLINRILVHEDPTACP